MADPNIPQPRSFGTGTRRSISPHESFNRPKNAAARRSAARFRYARQSRGSPRAAACPWHPPSPPPLDLPALSQRTRSEDQTQRWLQPGGISCLLPCMRFYSGNRVRATAHLRAGAGEYAQPDTLAQPRSVARRRNMLVTVSGAGDRSRTASAAAAAPHQPRPAHGSSDFDGKPGPQ
jgi:hypothetical protein